MMGYSMPNMSQMRVCNADCPLAARFGSDAWTLSSLDGRLILPAPVFARFLAFALGATDPRFFAEGLVDLGFGARDLRFFAGGLVDFDLVVDVFVVPF